jgi:hypothetical protein
VANVQDAQTRIENYRTRAEEIRVLAETMKPGEARETMIRVAADYLRMAERLERNPEILA